MTKRAGCLVAICALMVACGSSDDEPGVEPSATTAPTSAIATPTTESFATDAVPSTSEPVVTTTPRQDLDPEGRDGLLPNGVAVSWEPVVDDASFEPDEAVAGSLTLERCRWREPGRYVFDLRWDGADHDFPLSVPIELLLFVGDMGTGGGGVVTLDGPGEFSVPLSLEPTHDDDDRERWESGSGMFHPQQYLSCVAIAGDDAVGPGSLAIEVDPAMPDEPPFPAGTVEALASSVDYNEQPDTSWIVASLLEHDELPHLDRLFLAVDEPLTSIRVSRTGTCIEIVSLYSSDNGNDTVEVTQSSGCPNPESIPGVTPGWEHLTEVVVADGGWQVTAVGEATAANAVAANIVEVPFAEPGPPPSAGFDADAYLDGRVAEVIGEGGVELIRFDWRDGRVAMVRTGGSDWATTTEVIASVEDPFNAGASAVKCRAWSLYESTTERGGFAIATVTDGRSIRFDPDGPGPIEPRFLDLTGSPTLPDVSAAFIDLDGALPFDQIESIHDAVTVLDADGTPTPCIQE